MNKRAMVGGIIILVIMVFAIYQGTGMGRKWQTVPVPTTSMPKITPVPTVDVTSGMEVFTNDRMGYSILKPAGWDASSITDNKNFDDRQIFLPGANNGKGNVAEISVTVVKKPADNSELATQADWQKWLDSPVGATDSSGLVRKFGEKMIDGNRAVVLWQDRELPAGYSWSILTWIRRSTTNYYVDALGSGKFEDAESRLFDYMAGSFKVK